MKPDDCSIERSTPGMGMNMPIRRMDSMATVTVQRCSSSPYLDTKLMTGLSSRLTDVSNGSSSVPVG